MKTKILFTALILLGLTTVFSGCKKESTTTDPRDKFVGTYSGNLTLVIPDVSANNTSQSTFDISKNTSNSSQIYVDGKVANVNDNSFTYSNVTETVDDPNLGTVVMTLTGIGTLNGSSLTESGTATFVIQGTSYPGTWSRNSVKQ